MQQILFIYLFIDNKEKMKTKCVHKDKVFKNIPLEEKSHSSG